MKNYRLLFIFATVLLVAALALVPYLTNLTLLETERKSQVAPSTTIPAWDSESLLAANFNGLAITISAYSVDLPAYTLKGWIYPDAYGDLLVGGNDTLGRLASNVVLSVGKRVIEFKENQPPNVQEISFLIDYGSENYYPFDDYGTFLSVSAWIPPSGNQTMRNVPIALSMVGSVTGFDFEADVEEITDENSGNQEITVDMQMQRSWSVQFFSVFVMLTMWALSLCTFYMTLQFGLAGFYETNLIELCTALLFALPALRSASPAIPAMGCSADIASFFGCMLLVAGCDVVLFVKFLIRRMAEIKENSPNSKVADEDV